jgi:hypothetical protein
MAMSKDAKMLEGMRNGGHFRAGEGSDEIYIDVDVRWS